MPTSAPCPPLSELIQWLEPVFVPEQDIGKQSGPWLLREADVLFDQPRRYWEQAGITNLMPQQRLQDGDVIVHPQYLQRATVFVERPYCFVACAPLRVCRVLNQDQLVPAYLAWYLGTDLVKAALFDAMKFTRCVATGPQELDAITIPLVSMALQKQIAQSWHDLVACERSNLEIVAQIRQNLDKLLVQQIGIAGATSLCNILQTGL